MSQKIFSLIPKIMAEVGAIGKDRRNEHQKYQFRGIEDMYNAIQPALVKHGVFCVPQVLESSCTEGETKSNTTNYHVVMRVNHKFYADDGSFVEVITAGEGLDSSDKASNKAMSAAMKYAFIELLSLPTEDVADSDRESPEAGKSRSQFPIGNVTKTQGPNGGFF